MKKFDYLIVGKSVSKNARSPQLWNKVFENLGVVERMGSFDLELKSATDFQNFVKAIPHVKGLAIAFPNKFHVESLLFPDKTYPVGINVVRIEGTTLTGMNFDGVGALESLLINTGQSFDALINDFQFVVFGTGSTAHSFQKALVDSGLGTESVVLVSSRNSFDDGIAKIRLFNSQHNSNGSSKRIILINATPLGSVAYSNSTPFGNKLVEQLKGRLEIVFDFNYGVKNSGPEMWASENAVKYFNGTLMNLFQAAHSFKFATGSEFDLEVEQIVGIMKGAG